MTRDRFTVGQDYYVDFTPAVVDDVPVLLAGPQEQGGDA